MDGQEPSRRESAFACKRAGAAEGDQRVVARVVALFDRHQPQRPDHVLVDDVVDALRRVLERLAERRRDLADCFRRERAVELEVAAEALHRRQVAEHDVRVRHRRFRAAAAVGRRSRVCARGLRADAQRLGQFRHMRDRAAAGADRADVDRGGAHRHVADRRLAPQARHAIADERDVGRGAADVDGQQVRKSGLQRDPERAGDAARGTRHQEVHRVILGRGRGGQAAVRTQDVQLHVAGPGGELVREVADVALHHRPHVGIRDGRHRALVLLHLRHDLGGERHRHARQHRARDLADAPLVRVVREGIDERDGERLDLRVLQFRERIAQRRLVERPHHGAARIHALVGLDGERQRRHRQRLVVDHPAAEAARHVGAGDLQHLAVAFRRHEADFRAGARQHGVGRDGRAVHHVVDRARLRCRRACRCGRGLSARRPTGPSACSAPWRSRCGRSSRRPAGGP